MWFLGREARGAFLGRNSPCCSRRCKTKPLLRSAWVQFLHLRVGTRIRGLDVFSFLSVIGLNSSSHIPDSPGPGMVPYTVSSLQVTRKRVRLPHLRHEPRLTLFQLEDSKFSSRVALGDVLPEFETLMIVAF